MKIKEKVKKIEDFIFSYILAPILAIPISIYVFIDVVIYSQKAWPIKIVYMFSTIMGFGGGIYAPISYYRKRTTKS